MDIKNESELNGVAVRAIRQGLRLSQKKFWGAVCVLGSRGCAYETGSTDLPAPVRRLVFLHYVLGIPTDISSTEGQAIQKAKASGRSPAAVASALKDITKAGAALTRAKEKLNDHLAK